MAGISAPVAGLMGVGSALVLLALPPDPLVRLVNMPSLMVFRLPMALPRPSRTRNFFLRSSSLIAPRR
jgi:hypothetical protein